MHDQKLGRTDATFTAMGVETAFVGFAVAKRPTGQTVRVASFDTVPAPGKRSEFYISGVFKVPAQDSLYELTLTRFRFRQPSQVWKRSSQVSTIWAFRSELESDVFSAGPAAALPAGRPARGRRSRRLRDRCSRSG